MKGIKKSPSYLIRNAYSYCFRMKVPKELQDIMTHRKGELTYLSERGLENIETVKELTKDTTFHKEIDLLKQKLMGSGIEKYVEVKAYVRGKTEKKLLKEFLID